METMKMDMSSAASSAAHSCKISMLWNWYTVDTCFLAKSWHVRTKGQFAGSCIGSFLLVVSAQWLNRLSREYDLAIQRRTELNCCEIQLSEPRNRSENEIGADSGDPETSGSKQSNSTTNELTPLSILEPILDTISHSWLLRKSDGVYPTFAEHVIKSLLFTVQWGLSYIIMLLFMYYNGYIIISCVIGAFVGRMLFNHEPLTLELRAESMANDKKCCM